MTQTTSRSSEDVISGILNWVCPECGGRMGGRTREFKCQGECQRDWRQVWESSLVTKPARFVRRDVHLTAISAALPQRSSLRMLRPARCRRVSWRSRFWRLNIVPSRLIAKSVQQ